MPLIKTSQLSSGKVASNDVAQEYEQIAQTLARGLTNIVNRISDPEIAAAFWAEQGSGGLSALLAFSAGRALLQQIAPDLVSGLLAQAGETLKVNQETGVVSLPTEPTE